MKRGTNYWRVAVIFALVIFPAFFDAAYADRSDGKSMPSTACRFLKNMGFELPFNTIELTKEDMVIIADAVEDTKTWPSPAVGIQATVSAGAYIGERDLDVLKKRRGDAIKAYLMELGIPSRNIYVDPVVMTDDVVFRRADGGLAVQQIAIELAPICKGGSCAWMCGPL
ncbi:hypothetical protein LJ656_08935 [Paraburkholderia sp. MMS20-SJTR3]|uniref:OmpA-like domain-containing protein n=1 Tax=Paraburkholderia sejongensis TaxID=2886946 RepID=A0ABS8JS29_9BURK|nr:hypothetical protein [Paraburkholderia sp. MMS20-SJTR3]MCC8392711.1 hypothetical protein [Paraburkholderia sp. MMS20-SJTR3]